MYMYMYRYNMYIFVALKYQSFHFLTQITPVKAVHVWTKTLVLFK
jgi:hypothetical protein